MNVFLCFDCNLKRRLQLTIAIQGAREIYLRRLHNTCGQAERKMLNSSAMLNLLEEVKIKCDVHARLIFLGQSRTWLCKYSPMSVQFRSGKGHFRVEKKGEKGD